MREELKEQAIFEFKREFDVEDFFKVHDFTDFTTTNFYYTVIDESTMEAWYIGLDEPIVDEDARDILINVDRSTGTLY